MKKIKNRAKKECIKTWSGKKQQKQMNWDNYKCGYNAAMCEIITAKRNKIKDN